MALDYGTVRCGAAISDPTGIVVRPLTAVEPPDPASIASLAGDEEAELIVVGLPVSMDGEERDQARLTREFIQELREMTSLPVETYDERLTTALADRSARSGASADRDSLAAAHLLETYLSSKGGGF